MSGAIPQRPIGSTTSPTGAAIGPAQSMTPASVMNSFRVAAVTDRLAMHIRTGQRSDPLDFFNLCLLLARGIDCALANNDVPARAQDLPLLLKQVYQRKSEFFLQAAIMVLMISVKSACKCGWFLVNDADELLTLANKIESTYCSVGNINAEPSNASPIISKIISRFYPRVKIDHVLATLEVKPGYGTFMADFHISKNMASVAQKNILLFVAQTDNTESSSCIVSPPLVNFLLNGKGVARRTNVSMDNGPQFPTNVTSMLKYGTNLLQAIGYFNGNYIISIAVMSVTSSSDTPVLQDYIQTLAAIDSDSDIIEGPSRISLNCPISAVAYEIGSFISSSFGFAQGLLILTKLYQRSAAEWNVLVITCFDYNNFVEINSRRPAWRCPHCNQSVCYTDIRIDQNMVKVLKEIGENGADVIISADGSWKPVVESTDHTYQLHDGTLRFQQDGSVQCESMRFSNTPPNVVDLTVEGIDDSDAMDTCETEDRKPFGGFLQGFSTAGNLTVPPEINNTSEVVQNAAPEIEDDFWLRVLLSCSDSQVSAVTSSTTSDAHMFGGISESPHANFMLAPVLTDAVSPALNQEIVDVRGATQPTTSLPQSQFSAPNNLQLEPSEFGHSIINSDTSWSSIPRYVSRTPTATQALPAQTQVPNSHQRPRTNWNSLMPNGAPPVASQTPSSMTPIVDSVVGNDTERQQQFSRSIVNPLPASGWASSSMQHHSVTQNWDNQNSLHIPYQSFQQVVGLPATSQVPGAYRGSSGLRPELQNPHHQQPPNVWVPQPMIQPHIPCQSFQQVVGLPATSQVPGAYRGSSGIRPELQNPHHQQPPNVWVPQPMIQPPRLVQPSSHFPPMQVQQGAQAVAGQAAGSVTNLHARVMAAAQQAMGRPPPTVPVQLQAPRAGSSFPMTAHGIRVPIGEQRGGNMGGMVQPVSRADGLVELPSEQNWHPTGQMRGSLAGRAYSAAFSQFVIQPTQPAQAARPPSDLTSPPGGPSQLQFHIVNSTNAHGPQPQTFPRTGDITGRPGSFGIMPM